MNPDQILPLIGALIAGAAAVYGATYAGRTSSKASKEATAVTFSKNLMDRLEKVEQKVERLERNFSTAINFIERMVFWARGGSKPPIPEIPSSLKEFFDPSLTTRHEEEIEKADNA